MFLFCFVAASGCWEDSKHCVQAQPGPPGGVKTSSELQRAAMMLQCYKAARRHPGQRDWWPGTDGQPDILGPWHWVPGHQTVLFNYVKKIIRWAPPVSTAAHYTLYAVSSTLPRRFLRPLNASNWVLICQQRLPIVEGSLEQPVSGGD